MAKPAVPERLHLLIASWGMKSPARNHGVGKQGYSKPYVP
jgi:hypothetical protein